MRICSAGTAASRPLATSVSVMSLGEKNKGKSKGKSKSKNSARGRGKKGATLSSEGRGFERAGVSAARDRSSDAVPPTPESVQSASTSAERAAGGDDAGTAAGPSFPRSMFFPEHAVDDSTWTRTVQDNPPRSARTTLPMVLAMVTYGLERHELEGWSTKERDPRVRKPQMTNLEYQVHDLVRLSRRKWGSPALLREAKRDGEAFLAALGLRAKPTVAASSELGALEASLIAGGGLVVAPAAHDGAGGAEDSGIGGGTQRVGPSATSAAPSTTPAAASATEVPAPAAVAAASASAVSASAASASAASAAAASAAAADGSDAATVDGAARGEKGTSRSTADDVARVDVGAVGNVSEWAKTLEFLPKDGQHLAAQEMRRKSRTRASRTVLFALAGNFAVLCGKGAAAFVSGSGSMMAETLHSVADCMNQALLVVGIHRSQKAASREHPYGHATEVYVWAIISATGAFFLGSGVCVYHGIDMLMHPTPVDNLHIPLAVLGLSFLAEASTLAVAVRSVRESARELGVTVWNYLRGTNDDPMSVTVLIEDAASVTGILIATASLLATAATGNPVWDAVGTLAVGGLLGVAATWLIKTNMKALIGRSMPAHREAAVIMALRADPIVQSLHDVKTVVNGPGTAKFKAEILFDGLEIGRRTASRYEDRISALRDRINAGGLTEEEVALLFAEYGDMTTETMGNEIDRLENLIREVAPEVVNVDLEAL